MAILPHINRMKFGVIDQDYMNQLATSTSQFDDIKGGLKQLLSVDTRRGSDSFLAEITASTAHATSGDMTIAWRYSWQRVDFVSLYFAGSGTDISTDENYQNPETGANNSQTGYFQTVIGGSLAAYSAYAYNLAEISNINTFPIVFGVDVQSTSYPETFSPRPLASSSYVWLTKNVDQLFGIQSYIFDRQGTHDGECQEP